MTDWDFFVKNLVFADVRASYSTRADRLQMLQQIGQQLHDMGYNNLRNPQGLKPKHITALVETWKKEGKPVATIKNRLANLRWLVKQPAVAKQNIIPRTNAELGVENRVYLSNETQRAFSLLQSHLEAIKSESVRASLMLQKEFGLRREEAIKIKPWLADKKDHLHLQASWCKGGRERKIPIQTEAQRAALEFAKKVAEKISGRRGSLIPKDLKYVTQKYTYENQTKVAGIDGHGIRHQKAQDWYKEKTGLDCPKAGGPTWKELTPEQRLSAHAARLEIAALLGHGREIIANSYLGK